MTLCHSIHYTKEIKGENLASKRWQKRAEGEIGSSEPTLHLIKLFGNTTEDHEVFKTFSQLILEDC